MGVECCESNVVKRLAELGPVVWPYRKRYSTKKSPLAQLSWYRLCRLNIFTCQLVSRIWNPFEDLATNRKLPYPLGFASLLTTVDSVRHDFSSSLQMQGDKTMLKLASSLGFMYRILFFASVTDTSTLMAWNIRQSKDDAFSSNFLYLWHIFLLRGRIPMCQGGNKSRDIRGQQCRAWWRWCPYDSQIPRNDALHNSFMWHSYGRRELWEQGCKEGTRIRACTLAL